MLVGERVVLRDWRRSDVEARWRVSQDVQEHAVVSDRPFESLSLEAALARHDKRLTEPDPSVVLFAISRADDPAQVCVGDVLLWGVDPFHRMAHIGIGLSVEARGQGYGREALALICRFGFESHGLDRLQLETLARNVAMQRTAVACGFVLEGRMRSRAWVLGAREDELVYGLLAEEWRAAR